MRSNKFSTFNFSHTKQNTVYILKDMQPKAKTSKTKYSNFLCATKNNSSSIDEFEINASKWNLN